MRIHIQIIGVGLQRFLGATTIIRWVYCDLMDKPPDQVRFAVAMAELKKRRGGRAEAAAYRAFAVIVEWICEEGHGNFHGACKNYIVGRNIRFETYRDTDERLLLLGRVSVRTTTE